MNIQIKDIDLKLKRPFTLSRGTTTERKNIIIDIDGNYGEGAPLYYRGQTAEEIMQASQAVIDLLSKDNDFDYLHHHPWPRELGIYPGPALCAVSQAVYGYLANSASRPLYDYLGIPEPKNIRTSFSIGIVKPGQLESIVAGNPGYNAYKLKLGSDDDIDIVKEFRRISDAELRLDANGGWSYDEAVAKMNAMSEFNIEFVEQPLAAGSFNELDDLAANTDIPIIVDEDINTFSDMMNLNRIVHGINVKLSKCGSIFDSIAIIQYARRTGMKVMLGCMVESSVGITAALHLASLVDYVDLDGNLLIENDPYRGAVTQTGNMSLPEGNGLGVSTR